MHRFTALHRLIRPLCNLRIPGSNVFRNIQQYPEAREIPGILVVRLDAPLYFGNCNFIRDKLDEYEKKAEEVCVLFSACYEFALPRLAFSRLLPGLLWRYLSARKPLRHSLTTQPKHIV